MIKDTIRAELPEGFQKAEYMQQHGVIDIVVARKDLRGTLGRVVDLLGRRVPSADIVPLPLAGEDGRAPGTELLAGGVDGSGDNADL